MTYNLSCELNKNIILISNILSEFLTWHDKVIKDFTWIGPVKMYGGYKRYLLIKAGVLY